LPEVVKSKLLITFVKESKPVTDVVVEKTANKGKDIKIGMMRAVILGKMKSLHLKVEEFTSLYNLGRVDVPGGVKQKYSSIDDSTIYRWLKMSPSCDPHLLAPEYGRTGDGAGEKTLTIEDKKILSDLYFTKNKWTAAKCHRTFYEKTGNDVSYATVKRFYASFPPAFHAWRRIGSKELNDKFMPYQERDYTKFAVMGLWCSDHHMLDLFVRDGKKFYRPWVTAFQDMRSRKIVGWHISKNPCTYTILQALYHGVTNFGCPDGVYFDNGADYKSKRLNGYEIVYSEDEKLKINGVFQKYNIGVHFAEPYHGQSKPIERFFRTLLEEFSKTFNSFTGSNTSITLQENIEYKKHVEKTCKVTIDEVKGQFDTWITKWNASWSHSGNGMNGRTPDDVFNEGIKNRIRIDIDMNYKQALFSTYEHHPITRNGVKFDGRDYYNLQFVALLGKKVNGRSVKYKIVRDIDDVGKVYVYDRDDNLICEAFNNIMFGSGATEENIGQIKKKRKDIKKVLKGYIDLNSELIGSTFEEQLVNSLPEKEEQVKLSTLKNAAGAEWFNR